MITVRAPYRMSFLGGGTDLPEWYMENKGAVLSTTINKYCYITARVLPPYFEHKHRIVWSQIELAHKTDDIIHPIVKETIKYLGIKDGLEIHHAGDIPARTGMGASSSFTVAIIHALRTMLNQPIDKKQLAFDAIHIERDLCCECVGSQDQTASAFGGFNRIDFSAEDIKLTKVDPGNLYNYLSLYFTGFQHNASDIERRKVNNIKTKRSEFEFLYSLVDEGIKAINNPVEFGRLLNEGWLMKRSMADKTSTDYIDFLYDKAKKAGAIGGKILGAGGGGFLLLLAEPDYQPNVKKAMSNLLEMSFSFETKGSEVISNNGNS